MKLITKFLEIIAYFDKTIFIFLITIISTHIVVGRKIVVSLTNGINNMNTFNLEKARKEFENILKCDHYIIFKRLIIFAKICFFETYQHEILDKEKNLEYAKTNEEILLKSLPDYSKKESLVFAKYKYQYAALCCNLGNTYNELALIRDAMNNYYKSKDYSLKAIDVFRRITKINNFYLRVFATSYGNLAVSYRGIANINRDSGFMQLALNNAKESLAIFKKIGDYYNIAKLQNNIGNIYSDLIDYEDKLSEQEKMLNYSERYYYESLEFYKVEKYPFEFARTRMNIGSLNTKIMVYTEDKEKAYSYYLKAEENYELCKKILKKDKYETNYLMLHRNITSLHYQALKKLDDINILNKIFDSSNILLKDDTIEKNTRLYLDTNKILVNALMFVIDNYEFLDLDLKIQMIKDAISGYEIALGFEELSINEKVKILVDLASLNRILFDELGLKIYEEKYKNYCLQIENILNTNPEILL